MVPPGVRRLAFVVVVLAACSQPPARDEGPAGERVPAPPPAAPHDARGVGAADGGADGAAPAANVAGAAAIEAPAPALAVVDAPMAWSEERARLTLAYRRMHSDPEATDLAIEPRVIVLHYTGGGSAKGTRGYFDQPRIEARRPQLARAGAVNVSAHYVVDRDGTIFRLQPDTRYARHCIGLNHVAIGIENVGDEARWPLTAAQVTANVALVRELARTHRITHVVGHHEVMEMRAHPYFVELDRSYRNRKPDPGPAFLAKVRAAVVDLELAGP